MENFGIFEEGEDPRLPTGEDGDNQPQSDPKKKKGTKSGIDLN